MSCIAFLFISTVNVIKSQMLIGHQLDDNGTICKHMCFWLVGEPGVGKMGLVMKNDKNRFLSYVLYDIF